MDHDLEGVISGPEGPPDEHDFCVRVRGDQLGGEHVARCVGDGAPVAAEQLLEF
jgi:hypothetical protein